MSQTEHDTLCLDLLLLDPGRARAQSEATLAARLAADRLRAEYDAAAYAITLTIRDEVPFEPWKPQRRPGWTARQYRAARRAYRRQCKAWAKAGRTSTVERRLYVPRCAIASWDGGES